MRFFSRKLINWLTKDAPPPKMPLCDFERICYEIRPGDVILVEGRNNMSDVIQLITKSPWSHSALYIGRVHDIENPYVRETLLEHFKGDRSLQLVIEGYIGQGTVVNPLSSYHESHLRICRPRGLSQKDAQQVIAYAVSRLGTEYDVRHIFDLMRFLLPWSIFPRSWRSTLFRSHAGQTTRTICSTMIAEAFSTVEFPILPQIASQKKGVTLSKGNMRLFTPRDFDYSPYFDIIKYPFINFDEHKAPYRNLPWQEKLQDPTPPKASTDLGNSNKDE